MGFVGLISESKKEDNICRFLEKRLKEKKTTVIAINKKSMDNMKNIKFDTILLTGNLPKKEEEKEKIRAILQGAKRVVINTDQEEYFSILSSIENPVISYGFNQKATITASSVEEDYLQLCLQRGIEDIEKNEIEPQEITVNLQEEQKNMDKNVQMGIASVLLLYGVKS